MRVLRRKLRRQRALHRRLRRKRRQLGARADDVRRRDADDPAPAGARRVHVRREDMPQPTCSVRHAAQKKSQHAAALTGACMLAIQLCGHLNQYGAAQHGTKVRSEDVTPPCALRRVPAACAVSRPPLRVAGACARAHKRTHSCTRASAQIRVLGALPTRAPRAAHRARCCVAKVRHTRTRARTRAHTRARAHACTQTHPRTHAPTNARTYARMRARGTRSHVSTRAQMLARALMQVCGELARHDDRRPRDRPRLF